MSIKPFNIFGSPWTGRGIAGRRGGGQYKYDYKHVKSKAVRTIREASKLLFKKNKDTIETIGAESVSLIYTAYEDVGNHKELRSDLTESIDTTSSGDQVMWSLTNSTGETRVVTGVGLEGKKVRRFSNEEGYTHDAFKDKESIRKDGPKVLHVGNNMIQNKTLTNKQANWRWKYHRKKRHIYIVMEAGVSFWYESGEWYTLTINKGDENVSATCKCFNVDIERSAGELGTTVIHFMEVQTGWTFDSNSPARYISGGMRLPNEMLHQHVIVGSSGYVGEYNYLCDGTDDEVEIQAAIDWLAGTYNGGVVELTEGTFNIGANDIVLHSGIVLMGRGKATILVQGSGDYVISAQGSDGSELDNIIIQDLQITSAYVADDIYFTYVQDSMIRNVTITDYDESAIHLNESLRITIQGNTFVNGADFGIEIDRASADYTVCKIIENTFIHCDNIYPMKISNAENSFIENNHFISCPFAIWINGSFNTAVRGNVLSWDMVRSTLRMMSSVDTAGILVQGNNNLVEGNTVRNQVIGIHVESGATDNVIIGNNCVDNGQLLDDGDCESGSDGPHITGDGDSQGDGTLSLQETAQKHTGTYSVKFNKDTAAAAGSAFMRFVDNMNNTDMHGLSVSLEYTLTAWVYIPSSGGPLASEVFIRLLDCQGSWATTAVAATTQDAWEFISVTRTIRASATATNASIEINTAAEQNEYIHVDDVRLYPTGIDNTHELNFDDDSATTNATGNSWQ